MLHLQLWIGLYRKFYNLTSFIDNDSVVLECGVSAHQTSIIQHVIQRRLIDIWASTTTTTCNNDVSLWFLRWTWIPNFSITTRYQPRCRGYKPVLFLFPYNPHFGFLSRWELLMLGCWLWNKLFDEDLPRLHIQTARVQGVHYIRRRHQVRDVRGARCLRTCQSKSTPVLIFIDKSLFVMGISGYSSMVGPAIKGFIFLHEL